MADNFKVYKDDEIVGQALNVLMMEKQQLLLKV
jgi:hypothetical protein